MLLKLTSWPTVEREGELCDTKNTLPSACQPGHVANQGAQAEPAVLYMPVCIRPVSRKHSLCACSFSAWHVSAFCRSWSSFDSAFSVRNAEHRAPDCLCRQTADFTGATSGVLAWIVKISWSKHKPKGEMHRGKRDPPFLQPGISPGQNTSQKGGSSGCFERWQAR
jgi:hypothetical protein